MGFEAIISAIASEAADQVAEIRADTATQVAEIVDAAREAAELDQRRLQHGRDEEADRARARIVNRARLEADRQLARAREGAFQDALGRLGVRLEATVTSPDYEQTLGALYREASAVVPDDDAMVLVRKADEPLMRRLVGGAASVEGSLTCLGGVDIEAPDGRGVRNTLDSRLARSEPELRHLAVQMIPELARIGAEP